MEKYQNTILTMRCDMSMHVNKLHARLYTIARAHTIVVIYVSNGDPSPICWVGAILC